MTDYGYAIAPPAELGGGWRLRLLENGEEVGGGQRLPELPHGAGVFHLGLEPVQRVPLHRVGGCGQQPLQGLGHVLPAPDLHPLVPVDQAVFPVAEHLHPAGI